MVGVRPPSAAPQPPGAGRVLASGGGYGKAGAVELTERDKAILEFERSWWTLGGPKEALILERFELSATRYYQVLNELLEAPEAYEHDPLVVRRLRRQRDRRRRARTSTDTELTQAETPSS